MKDSKKKEKINMSEVEGSVSNIIVNWWNTYDLSDKTPKQVYEDVISILPPDRIKEPKVQGLLKSLSKARDINQSGIALGNFVLRGDHESVLHGYREVDRKFLKNFGRK